MRVCAASTRHFFSHPRDEVFLRFASTAKDVQDGDEQIRSFYYFMDQETERGTKKKGKTRKSQDDVSSLNFLVFCARIQMEMASNEKKMENLALINCFLVAANLLSSAEDSSCPWTRQCSACSGWSCGKKDLWLVNNESSDVCARTTY